MLLDPCLWGIYLLQVNNNKNKDAKKIPGVGKHGSNNESYKNERRRNIVWKIKYVDRKSFRD